MKRPDVLNLSAGVNQRGVRDHNGRLILSTIQRHGALPGSEIAKLSGLSSQTVSVILRSLEADGLLEKGEPQRGRVGKPSIPMRLDPEGAFAVGLKIGRRTADLVLTDFVGTVRAEQKLQYRFPIRDEIVAFLEAGLAHFNTQLGAQKKDRITGIGIALPFQIWNWHDTIGAPAGALDNWCDFDLPKAIAAYSQLPVFIENDATAACRAELIHGAGRAYRDFAHFFIGSFIGGGIVLNSTIYEGRSGNAGAFGSLPVAGPDAGPLQLIDAASLYLLEDQMVAAGVPPQRLWEDLDDWGEFSDLVDTWVARTSGYLAQSVLMLASVIDFEAVFIDGAFPRETRAALTDATRSRVRDMDSRGIIVPEILSGTIGPNARALGASLSPITASYFRNAKSTESF